jgi:PncC family amidohydrolase
MEGVVTYSNDAKIRSLGVQAELIAQHGAVSAEVAEAMAEGVKARAETDFGIAVTGIAGPGGGSAEKPVGFGLHRPRRRRTHRTPPLNSSRRPFAHTLARQPSRTRFAATAIVVKCRWSAAMCCVNTYGRKDNRVC